MSKRKTLTGKLRSKSRLQKPVMTKVILLVNNWGKEVEKVVMLITKFSNNIYEPILYDEAVNNLIHDYK